MAFDVDLKNTGGGFNVMLSGYVKVYNGTSWDSKPFKYWTGSAWVQKPVKYWNGTAWVLA